jgi:hypothetical protein
MEINRAGFRWEGGRRIGKQVTKYVNMQREAYEGKERGASKAKKVEESNRMFGQKNYNV